MSDLYKHQLHNCNITLAGRASTEIFLPTNDIDAGRKADCSHKSISSDDNNLMKMRMFP